MRGSIILIQARSNSKRFPNKVFHEINGIPLIEYAINAAKELLIPYYVCIPKDDNKLTQYLEKNNIPYYEGSENDVLDRFYQCVRYSTYNTIIRLCADTLYEKNDVLEQIELYKKRNKFTYGNGVFILSYKELYFCWLYAKGSHREHVTTFLYRCVDYVEDLERSPIADNIPVFF